ncbi:MAG: phosphoribosylamine--glycine ligase, partial [Phycisphaerae bacterium]|nr:phosphoribosylamine--glycine ligase [Phycisphaerae bacterium]
MNVLIIGGGGREHALGWKIAQSPSCQKLYFLPGNAGTAAIGENIAIKLGEINTKSCDEIARFCRDHAVELVVIGPEDPLAAGLADELEKRKLKVFGVGAAAARLEADKAWSKKLMRQAAVPTAEARVFTDANQALAYVEAHETPLVVKAAGLAKGKGVIVTDSPQEAADAVRRVMIDREFGEAGDIVVIEERLVGQEVSILALVDGETILVLEPSQDHKQVGEGDTGPNTGGMGAYTPTPLVTPEVMAEIEGQVLLPTLSGLRRENIDFRGVLYAGLMLTAGGPKVLEYNCRFGDPECQPLLVRMKGDLLAALLATCERTLDGGSVNLSWDDRVACCVVMCSGGYPGSYETGLPISGLEEAGKMPGVHIFHAGTALQDGKVVTSGGRVLSVVGLGRDLAEAQERANAACEVIHFDGAFFRRDIGNRVLGERPVGT